MKKQQHFKIVSIISLAIILAFTFTACGEDSDELVGFVWIPPGTFTMGSNDTDDYGAQPPHQVTLTKGFYMSKYAITQGQYFAIMEYNPSTYKPDPNADGKGRLPVEGISWYDAIVFCNKLSIKHGLQPVYSISGKTNPDDWGEVPTSNTHPNYAAWNAVEMIGPYPNVPNGYRLPTEAEWEYACRAGTTTAWFHGNAEPGLENYAWYYSNSDSMTHEVGKKLPNAWGLYDMHGNVREWCWDWYGSYTSGAKTDPVGAPPGLIRAYRGGNWDFSAKYSRSAYRDYFPPYYQSDYIGFRVVRP